MSVKTYLVVELTDQSNLREIVDYIKGRARRMAIVDAVPGIFESTGVRHLPLKDVRLPVRKRLRPNAEDSVPGMRLPKLEDEIVPPDVAAYVKYPTDHVDSEANIDVVTVDRNQGMSSMLDKTMDDEGSCSADVILNVTDEADDVKENIARLLEQSLDAEEMMEAEDVLPRKSGRKTRRSRHCDDGEYDVYRINKETVYCGLCISSITLRAGYGRTRLREHVLRHLNMPTVKCAICGFEGILREHIRRHHAQHHPGSKFHCVDVEFTEVFDKKFAFVWESCYPNRPKIAARNNYRRLIGGILDTSGTSKVVEEETDSVSDTMGALMQSLANNNPQQISDEELHEDDGEDDVKPKVEDFINESMTTHPSA